MEENEDIISEKGKESSPFSEVKELFSIALEHLRNQIAKNNELSKENTELRESIESLTLQIKALQEANNEI
jgi:hypothetical protein